MNVGGMLCFNLTSCFVVDRKRKAKIVDKKVRRLGSKKELDVRSKYEQPTSPHMANA